MLFFRGHVTVRDTTIYIESRCFICGEAASRYHGSHTHTLSLSHTVIHTHTQPHTRNKYTHTRNTHTHTCAHAHTHTHKQTQKGRSDLFFCSFIDTGLSQNTGFHINIILTSRKDNEKILCALIICLLILHFHANISRFGKLFLVQHASLANFDLHSVSSVCMKGNTVMAFNVSVRPCQEDMYVTSCVSGCMRFVFQI